MVPSERSVAPLSFPEIQLSAPYSDALRYSQFRLKMLGRGELKSFCDQYDLPYTSIVGLKNNTLKREEPRLLQRLLRHLDVATELIRIPPAAQSQRFLFASQEVLDTFQKQLRGFDSGISPLPESEHSAGEPESSASATTTG